MKAIRVHQFGGPEVLKLEEIPTPKPETGQVLVRVRAVGVNPYDTYMRAGTYAIKPPLPYTPGSDAAGTVGCITSPKPAPEKRFWCMAPVAESAQPLCKLPEPWE